MNYKRMIRDVPFDRATGERAQNVEDVAAAAYRVYEKEELAAEFSYHMDTVAETKYSGAGYISMNQFWIDEIQLASGFTNYRTIDAVLHFIQYKCWVAGCSAMYVRLSVKNLFYQELYGKYGFYVIAEEEKRILRGGFAYEYVMKYPLPDSREEEYSRHIRRKLIPF